MTSCSCGAYTMKQIGFTSRAMPSTKQQLWSTVPNKYIYCILQKQNPMGAETRTREVQPCIRRRPDLSNNRVVLCSVRCGKYAANICSVPLKKMFSQLLLFLASDMTRPCSSGKQNPQLATQFYSTFLSLLSMKEHSQVWSAKIGRRKNNREAVNQRNLPDAQEYCKHCLSQDKMEMIISHHLIRKSTTETRTSLVFWMLDCAISARCRRQ